MQLWHVFAVIAVIVAIAAAVKYLVLHAQGEGGTEPGEDELPYEKRRYLFTKAEKSFYLVLRGAVPEGYTLFAKVGLRDLLAVRKGTEKRQGFANKIASKHVDFLICDEQWLEPRLAIELDDKSHARADRVERDAFLERACASAGLELLRVPAQASYDQRELQSALSEKL
jgi:hypothetical protein